MEFIEVEATSLGYIDYKMHIRVSAISAFREKSDLFSPAIMVGDREFAISEDSLEIVKRAIYGYD